MKNTFILALNEFNIDLLKKYSKKFKLKNVKKFLQFRTSITKTKDRYIGDNNQYGYLDPWTQWVSINTQVDAIRHKVKNLGDIPKLNYKQIWEKKKNIKWYIWGVMNSSRRNAENVKFFFPDPWVFSENAYPAKLNKLLLPIKKMTKSRGNLGLKDKILNINLIFTQIILMIGLFELMKSLSIIFHGIRLFKGFKAVIFITWWEYLVFKIFFQYSNNFKNNCISYFFMNSLAHAQHHYWENNKYSKEIQFVLVSLDKILSKILKLSNYRKIIIGGMSQKNSSNEDLYLYEQIDHEKFLKKLSINFIKIEKLMTNDAYIFFKKKFDCNVAFSIINSCKMRKRKIFDVIKINDKCLFYKTSFIKKVKINEKIYISTKSILFNDYFKLITKRRGIHHHKGHILSEENLFPKVIYNHHFFNFLL
jgi:hypothetical protein